MGDIEGGIALQDLANGSDGGSIEGELQSSDSGAQPGVDVRHRPSAPVPGHDRVDGPSPALASDNGNGLTVPRDEASRPPSLKLVQHPLVQQQKSAVKLLPKPSNERPRGVVQPEATRPSPDDVSPYAQTPRLLKHNDSILSDPDTRIPTDHNVVIQQPTHARSDSAEHESDYMDVAPRSRQRVQTGMPPRRLSSRMSITSIGSSMRLLNLNTNSLSTLEDRSKSVASREDAKQLAKDVRKNVRIFMINPLQKWLKFRRFPLKMAIQVLKIIFVTIELVKFGYDREGSLEFYGKNEDALRELFIKEYEPVSEISPTMNLHTREDTFDKLDHFLIRYDNIETESIAAFDRLVDTEGAILNPVLGISYYDDITLTNDGPGQPDLYINSTILSKAIAFVPLTADTECSAEIDDGLLPPADEKLYNAELILACHGIDVDFDRLIQINITFPLLVVELQKLAIGKKPGCVEFNIEYKFSNYQKSASILLRLDVLPETKANKQACVLSESSDTSNDAYFSGDIGYPGVLTLEIIVCLLIFVSLFLNIRAWYHARRLSRLVDKTCHIVYKESFTDKDFAKFHDWWVYLIVFTDILVLSGVLCNRLVIEGAVSDVTTMYEVTAFVLGLACMMVWVASLRYLSYWKKLSLLLVTLKRAVVRVIQFLICGLGFFFGYMFCGWVVIGPYSGKFHSISSTSETLFSLINGDDMYPTYETITEDVNDYVWYFSRFYLYSFVSLYIYVVLSLFIAIILDTYEEIKHSRENPAQTVLYRFRRNMLPIRFDRGEDEPVEKEPTEKTSFLKGLYLAAERCVCGEYVEDSEDEPLPTIPHNASSLGNISSGVFAGGTDDDDMGGPTTPINNGDTGLTLRISRHGEDNDAFHDNDSGGGIQL